MEAHPFLHDIWIFIRGSIAVFVHHVFREANNDSDWVASFVAKHIGDWTLCQGDVLLLSLQRSFCFMILWRTLVP